jgi:hypothetical protein
MYTIKVTIKDANSSFDEPFDVTSSNHEQIKEEIQEILDGFNKGLKSHETPREISVIHFATLNTWEEDEDDEDDEDDEEPDFEPECTASEEEKIEDGTDDIDCEFEVKDGGWWCTTHNCHA